MAFFNFIFTSAGLTYQTQSSYIASKQPARGWGQKGYKREDDNGNILNLREFVTSRCNSNCGAEEINHLIDSPVSFIWFS